MINLPVLVVPMVLVGAVATLSFPVANAGATAATGITTVPRTTRPTTSSAVGTAHISVVFAVHQTVARLEIDFAVTLVLAVLITTLALIDTAPSILLAVELSLLVRIIRGLDEGLLLLLQEHLFLAAVTGLALLDTVAPLLGEVPSLSLLEVVGGLGDFLHRILERAHTRGVCNLGPSLE